MADQDISGKILTCQFSALIGGRNLCTEMDLDQIVQQLPVVIGDAVWRHLQKAKETSEAEVQLKGDVEISLPGLSISFSLYHTFKGDSTALDSEEKKTGDKETDLLGEEKTDNSSTDLTTNVPQEDTVSDGQESEVKSQSNDKDVDAKKASPKKTPKKRPLTKKRARSPSVESVESGEGDSDLVLTDDDESDPSSDVEYSIPFDQNTPARSSKRLRIKAETLGEHDFSKGVKRIRNLKPVKAQGKDSKQETPVSSKTAGKKTAATSNPLSGSNKTRSDESAKNQGPPTKSKSQTASKSPEVEDASAIETVVPVKKRGRGRPRKSETIIIPDDVPIKQERVESNNEISTNNEEERDTNPEEERDTNLEEERGTNHEEEKDMNSEDKSDSESTPDVVELAAEEIKLENLEDEINDATGEEMIKVYKCSTCSKTFDRKASLKEHMFIHNRESEFICDECKKPFSRWYKLKMHKVLKHGATAKKGNLPERVRRAPRTLSAPKKSAEVEVEVVKRDRPFSCEDCGKGFMSKMRLHEHKFLHKDDARFYCYLCLRRFSSFSKLERHFQVSHSVRVDTEFYMRLTNEILPPEGCSVVIKDKGETLLMRCNLCSDFEGSREDAIEHLKAHSDMLANACEYCDKKFLYIPALKTHQNYLHRHEFRQECSVCSKKFGRLEDLAIHAKKEHEVLMEVPLQQRAVRRYANKTPFPCPHCEQTFQKKSRLNDHIWVKHDKKEKPFKCSLCPRRFIREDILKDHMFVHDRKSRYVCETCGKAFKKKFELVQHRHLDDPWKCHICDKVFTTYNGYKLHIRKHTDVPTHMCRFCGAMFFFKGRLENHERSHTGEKPFECQVCQSRFSDRYVFNKHVKGHTVPDDSKHVCPTCNRKFLYPAQLRAHMQVHSTPRQKFPCHVCGKSYLKKESLRQHIKMHEDPEQEAQLYYQCEVCSLLYHNAAACEKCKNSHYHTANAVAEGHLTEEGNVAVDGLVENTVVTQVDDNTQVLVVSLEDLEHLGHQFVIEEREDGETKETVQHLILNPDQTLEIAPNQNIEIVNTEELLEQSEQNRNIQIVNAGELEHAGQVLLEEAGQELLEQPTQEFIDQPAQELIEQPAQELIEQPAQELIEQPGQELIEQPCEELILEQQDLIQEPNVELVEQAIIIQP